MRKCPMDLSVNDDINREDRSVLLSSESPMLKKSPEKRPTRKINMEIVRAFFNCEPADLCTSTAFCICMSSLGSIKSMRGGHVL